MRRPDNKKDEQHFQTPPMASQMKRSHDFGPSCGPLGSCWLNHTQGQHQHKVHISSYPAIKRWSWPPCAGPTTKRTSNTSRPLQWHHKRRGAMTSGHLAAPSEAAGSITLKGSTRYTSSYPEPSNTGVAHHAPARQQKGRATLPDPSNGITKEEEP